MSQLSVHDILGLSAYSNKIRIPSGHALEVEGNLKFPVWTSSTSYETSINESTDVTGGMALKVEVASRISKSVPLVSFVNGLDPENLHNLLIGEHFVGTRFERAKSDE